MTDVAIQKFREILFWPLEIPQLRQPTDASTAGDRLERFESQLTEGHRWRPEHDLLFRGESKVKGSSAYAELVFFHPFVQRFLYPAEKEPNPPLRLFSRTDVHKVRVVLSDQMEEPLTLDVERVHFYLFEHGVAILVVELKLEGGQLSLRQAEELLDRFRRAYPPYWDFSKKEDGTLDEVKAGHCPSKVEWLDENKSTLAEADYQKFDEFIKFAEENKAAYPASHWRYLLQPLEPWDTTKRADEGFSYRLIEDERMPFMAFLSLDDPGHLTRGDFVRLCFADGSGSSQTLPYAYDFLKNFEADYCYDRYWDADRKYLQQNPWADHWMTTRYLCCGYGFVMIGKEDGGGFFTDADNGALSHFRRHYFQMGLIAHFHRASLLLFSDTLSEAVNSSSDNRALRQQVSAVLERLLRFTHRYWFSEVSNQVQPRELFALWTRHLETQELFKQVRQEAQDAHHFLEMQEQKGLAEATMRLSVVATVGLPVGLLAAWLAVPWDDLGKLSLSTQAFWSEFPLVLTLALMVAIGLIVTIWQSNRIARVLDRIAACRSLRLVAVLVGLAMIGYALPANGWFDNFRAWKPLVHLPL